MTEGSIHTGSEPGDQERHEHTSANNEIHCQGQFFKLFIFSD